MTIPEKAAQFMEATAADDSHGYDQGSRWGTPDYDCSSLVITAYKHAGVPLQSTYTGNMKADFLSHGFENVTSKVNLRTGANMKRGDVLLNEVTHTAMYIGNGKIVHAAGNEYGKATGGKPGDQTGREICVANYYNASWGVVLRYKDQNAEAPAHGTDEPWEEAVENEDYYIVKYGDSLWSIAERFLGNGSLYPLIKQLNSMTSDYIYPGMMLILHPASAEPEKPEKPTEPAQPEAPAEEPTVPEEHTGGAGAYQIALQVLKKGDTGTVVRQAQRLLIASGVTLPTWGADGDFGDETESAVIKFQKAKKLEQTGKIDKPTMSKLLGL